MTWQFAAFDALQFAKRLRKTPEGRSLLREEQLAKVRRCKDIVVTAAHYVENKHRSVLNFGHLLKGERTIIPMVGEAAS